jgi:SAM-dependent methyltransferase
MIPVEESFFTREDRYGPILANQASGSTLRSIFEDVYGDDYPAEAEPFGFATLGDLRLCSGILAESAVTQLLDVGCGRGGPGLWVARELGASLVGVDIIAEGIADAPRLAAVFGMSSRAQFHVASATATGLAAAGFDGVISIDALWMVIDKDAAFGELARVLRPGGRLVFTSWEPAHLDYSRYLTAAGFRNITRQRIPGSAERQIAVYQGILRHREAITAELGTDAARVLVAEASETPEMLDYTPRVIITALRR